MPCSAWKRPLYICSLLLVLILPLLLSCDRDDGDRTNVRPTPVGMALGQPLADSVPFNGFNAYSVAATPGGLYKISMAEPSDDTDLRYFGGDASFTAQVACGVDNTAIEEVSPEDCIVAAPGGILYFAGDGAFLSTSAGSYIVAVEQLTITTISQSIPVVDSKARTAAGVYAVPANSGAPALAAVTGLNNDGDLHVFLDNTLTTPATCTTDNTRFSGSTPEDCRLTPSVLTLYLVVDSIFSTTPSIVYTAFANPAPVIAEPMDQGSPGSPDVRSLNTPTLGQVSFAGTSYYTVTGLTAGTRYTVSISGLTGNADLTVYNNSSFATPAECLIDNTFYADTTPEACTLVAAGSALYFKVDANTASSSVAFLTLIAPGP